MEYLIRRAQALEKQQSRKDRKGGEGEDGKGDAQAQRKRAHEQGATLEHLAQVSRACVWVWVWVWL